MNLMEIIEDRHGRKSTLIASQLPVPPWYEVISESSIADAILDRLIHGANRIELSGASLRKKGKRVALHTPDLYLQIGTLERLGIQVVSIPRNGGYYRPNNQ